MNTLFVADYERFTPNKYSFLPCVIRMIRNHELRFLFWGRIYQTSNNSLCKSIVNVILRRYRRKYGLELSFKKIGGGLKFLHPWNITVNANAVLKDNITLYKGCTIGEITDGEKKGNPLIESNVTIYANATVCGNITVGANSRISAGAFVNFDVPKNSIVIGNPGVIHNMKTNG